MTTLTKYISKEFIKLFLLCQFIFCSLFLVIDIVQRTDNFIEASVSKSAVLLFFLFKTPYIILQMIPASSMIAIILMLCIMKKNNEILAIRSGGFNIIRSLSPIFILSLLISLITFVFSEMIVPYSSSKSNEIWDIEVEKQDPTRFYGSEEIWYKSKNAIYWIKHFDINEMTMKSPTFYLFDKNFSLQKKISGENGIWKDVVWKIENVIVYSLKGSGTYDIDRFDYIFLEIPEKPETFARRTKNPEDMSYQQLKRHAEKVKDEGYDNSKYLVDLNLKLAFPFISLVLALIAVPIALGTRRGEIPLAVAFGIAVCFMYFSIMSFSRSLGLSGTLPPLLSAWTANLALSLFGIYLIMCVKK